MNERTRSAIGAGLAASLAMDLVQWGVAATFERHRKADDLDEETEAIAHVVRMIDGLLPGDWVGEHAESAGRLIHYIFGTAFALAYAAARRRWPGIAAGNGLCFGLVLWFASDVVLIPAAHFGRRYFRYSRAERLNAVASHLVYAFTTNALM